MWWESYRFRSKRRYLRHTGFEKVRTISHTFSSWVNNRSTSAARSASLGFGTNSSVSTEEDCNKRMQDLVVLQEMTWSERLQSVIITGEGNEGATIKTCLHLSQNRGVFFKGQFNFGSDTFEMILHAFYTQRP